MFNLDQLQPYSTRTEGNNVYVTLGERPARRRVGRRSTPPRRAAAAGDWTIEKVDFRRGADGAGRIMVRTSDPRVQASLKQEGGRLVVDFPRTTVPTDVARVTTWSISPRRSARSTCRARRRGARIVVAAPRGTLTSSPTRATAITCSRCGRSRSRRSSTRPRSEYKGERLTLNFQDIETRAVLQLLAETSGQNIVVSDSVPGNVTLRLQNVPWDQALDIVLRTKGLDKRQEGNVIYVAPAEELAAREKQQLESQKALTELAPVRTEYLQVNYAKASDLAGLIKQGKSSLLSDRGSVAIDERTNTLLLQDTSDRLADIRRLVQTLDIPVRQVLIEARIVIVNDDFSRELGVRFGGAFVGDYGGRRPGVYRRRRPRRGARSSRARPSSTNQNPGGLGNSARHADADGQRPLHGQPADRKPGRQDRDDAARFGLHGRPRDHGRAARRPWRGGLGAARDHRQRQGSGHRAGHRDPVPGIVLERRDHHAVQESRAVAQGHAADHSGRPRHPRPHGVEGQRRRRSLPSATGGFVPSIDTREITTQVLVNDGQTVVLGGILETERRDTVNKVPFLGDVPGLGVLFRSKARTDNKDELLIFVTPKILREGADVY